MITIRFERPTRHAKLPERSFQNEASRTFQNVRIEGVIRRWLWGRFDDSNAERVDRAIATAARSMRESYKLRARPTLLISRACLAA